ncbi:MAG: amino acid ABC transporter substrate-binding protein [Desulfobacterales bacterium]|nr:amino acid ABC transporter substrate-binding protein [Desulfobacterales bacterium]
MKKLLFFSLGLLLIISAVVGNNEIKAASKTITLRADVWFPYNGKPGSNKLGFMMDIAVAAFKEKGYKIDYKTLPWNRAIKEARAGKFDGIIGAFKEDAPDFNFPKNELGVSKTVFWVKKNEKWKYKNMSSLKSVSIGVIKDYSYGDKFDAYIKKNMKNMKKVQVSFGNEALKNNIRKVLNGRTIAFVEDLMVASAELTDMKLAGKFKTAGMLSVDKVYIAFSPKSANAKKYADILSDAVKKYRMNGKLKKIMAKYGLKDWK